MRSYVLVGALLLGLSFVGDLRAQHGLGGGEREWIKLEWDSTETENYAIEFEKGIAGSTIARIGEELEDALEQYILTFRVKPKKGAKLKVRLLDTLNTFEQVGGDPSHPGFFRPTDKYLVLLNKPFHKLIPTTYHEAFHQYLDMFLGDGVQCPTWFNEGMASYFERMKRRPHGSKALTTDLIDNRRLRMVREAVKTRDSIPLAQLIDASYKEFHSKDREDLYYTQSFAMAYYIMEKLNPKMALKYMVVLKKTQDVEQANAKLFGKERKRLAKMEKHFKKYILTVHIRKD